MKNSTGSLQFANDDVKNKFLSLNESEKKEFEDDLGMLIIGTHKQMVKSNKFEGHHYCNQRLGERKFRVELWMNLKDEKDFFILLQQFNELEIDDYLDNINSDKKLVNKGFTRL